MALTAQERQNLVAALLLDLWLACYTQEEIAEAVGFSVRPIGEFLNSIRNRENGAVSENAVSSENPPLTKITDLEFDEDPEDSNRLGVYMLDKRLLIKANHMDEHFKPPDVEIPARWLPCHISFVILYNNKGEP